MPRESEAVEGMTVGQLLSQVCRMTGHYLRTHMERLGLHRGQGFALIQLWHHDGVPQGDLARGMHIRPASVTNMLQRMERDGWISRERDADDQRVVRVYLTDRAKALRAKAQMVFREMEEDLGSIYSDEEQEMLKRLLLKLHDRFASEDELKHHVHGFPFADEECPRSRSSRKEEPA